MLLTTHIVMICESFVSDHDINRQHILALASVLLNENDVCFIIKLLRRL